MRKYLVLLMVIFSICWMIPTAAKVQASTETEPAKYSIYLVVRLEPFGSAPNQMYSESISLWKKGQPDQPIDLSLFEYKRSQHYRLQLEAGEYEYSAPMYDAKTGKTYTCGGSFRPEELVDPMEEGSTQYGVVAIQPVRFSGKEGFYVNMIRVYANENEESVAPIDTVEFEGGGSSEEIFLLEFFGIDKKLEGESTSSRVYSCTYRYEVEAADTKREVAPDTSQGIPEGTCEGGSSLRYAPKAITFQDAKFYNLQVKAPKNSGLKLYNHINGTAYKQQDELEAENIDRTAGDYDVYTFSPSITKQFELVAGGRGTDGEDTGYKRTVVTLPSSTAAEGRLLEYTLELEKSGEPTQYRTGTDANDLYTNVKNSYLSLASGGSARVEGFRMKQTAAGDVSNRLSEPQMTFTPVYGEEKIELIPGGGFGREYYTVKAKEGASGIAILKVSYDEINIVDINWDGEMKTKYNFPAIDDSNMGIVVVDIANDTSGMETGLKIPGWDGDIDLRSDYDTVYIPDITQLPDGSEEVNESGTSEYKFTPPAGSTVRVHDPIHLDTQSISDDEWYAPEVSGDGTVTLNLKAGQNIIEITNQGQKAYATIKGKMVDILVENTTHPKEAPIPGDTLAVSFTGLNLPVYKMACIYNPGYDGASGTVRVKYKLNRETQEDGQTKLEELEELEGQRSQYLIATRNTVTFEVGEKQTYVLNQGQIVCPHAGDGLWGHTQIPLTGRRANLNASSGKNDVNFCIMPEITVKVEGSLIERVEALIDKIDKDNPVKTVQEIIEAKAAYDALKTSEQRQVNSDKVAILNSAYAKVAHIIDLIERIDKLPDSEDVTGKQINTIETVNYEYLDLTEEEQAAVYNYSPKMEDLMALVDSVRDVESQIAALLAKGNLTIDDAEAVAQARAAYDALDLVLQSGVSNRTALLGLEKQIINLEAAQTVIEQIASIGEVTAENYDASQEAVLIARNMLARLTDDQKALVANTEALEAAEAAIQKLRAEEDIRSIVEQIGILRTQEDGTPGPLAQVNTLETWEGWKGYVLFLRGMVNRLEPERQELISNLADLELAETLISGNAVDYVTYLIESLPDEEDIAQRELTEEEIQGIAAAMNAYRGLTQEEQAQIPELIEKLNVLDRIAAEQSADGNYLTMLMEEFARQVDAYYSQNPDGAVARIQLEEAAKLLEQYEAYPDEYRAAFDAMVNSQKITYGEQMAALKKQTAALEQQIEETAAINELIDDLPDIVDADNVESVLTQIAAIERRYAALSEDGKSYVSLTVPQVLKKIAQGLKQEMDAFKGAAVSGVKATVVNYQKVKVTWSKYSKATGYILQRKAGTAGWKTLEELNTVTSYNDTTVKVGITYKYRVCAVSIRWSDNEIVSKYGTSGNAKPSLNAAALKSVKASSKQAIKVTWKKVAGATGYEIYRSTSKKGKFKKVKTVTKGSTLSFTNKSLKKGTTYYYKVRAYCKVSGKKVYSAYSGIKSAKTKKK